MSNTVTGKELAERLDVARSTLSEATKKGYRCGGHPVSEWARRSESGRVQGYVVPGELLDGEEGNVGGAAATASSSPPPPRRQARAGRPGPSDDLRAIRERRRQERRQRERERREQERRRQIEFEHEQRKRERERRKRRKRRLQPPPGEERTVEGARLLTCPHGRKAEAPAGDPRPSSYFWRCICPDCQSEVEYAGELEPTDTADHELLPDYDAGTANASEGPNPPENSPDGPNSTGSVPKSRALVLVEDDDSGEEGGGSSWGEWAMALGTLGLIGWVQWESAKAEVQLANQNSRQTTRRTPNAPTSA